MNMETKPQERKLKRLGGLMIISELILLVFMMLWIYGQYHSQQNLMQQELKFAFDKSYDTLTDKLLDKTVDSLLSSDKIISTAQLEIEPADFKDTAKLDSLMKMLPDSIKTMVMQAAKENKGNITTIHSSKFIPLPSKVLPSLLSSNLTKTNEIKKIMRTTLEQVLESNVLTHNMELPVVDSNILKQDFTESIHHKRNGLNTQWTRDTANHFAFTSRANKNSAIMVSGYKYYLLVAILPQTGFVIFLISLTGIAFWLAYKNMKQQALFAMQKDSFISNISHELKTPVATTKVALEALSTFNGINDPERTKKYLQVAEWEMERLAALINSVLNTVQTESGSLHLEMEQLDPVQVLQDITTTMLPIISEKNIIVEWGDMLHGVKVLADEVHLKGVFYNIIDNAIKYGNGIIKLHADLVGNTVYVSISNNGTAIPDDYKTRIFEKFFRIPSGNRHTVKGHGLGLSYALYVMHMHGGNISLESNTDQTTFIVTLPKA